jgi:hypothetical protein
MITSTNFFMIPDFAHHEDPGQMLTTSLAIPILATMPLNWHRLQPSAFTTELFASFWLSILCLMAKHWNLRGHVVVPNSNTKTFSTLLST